MCGLAGILGPSHRARAEDIERMTAALAHRGPDDRGTWTTRVPSDAGEATLALGHTRLSILDLSAAGHQPMSSPDGRVTVSYNGEIYNFRSIRKELIELGHAFRSDCDTEVLIAAYREWGLAAAERFVGMFAFALWDAERRRLVLLRDRLGIKPLFYRLADGVLTFGSELSALRAHGSFAPRIDRVALGSFLRSGYVVGERTIYADVRRVEPGGWAIFEGGRLTTGRWWSLLDAPEPAPPTFAAAVARLEALLADAVEARLVADVPVGAFLSGGVDSTTVVALMRERATAVRTFSIGFDEPAYDESPYAREVARHLGTEHTELVVGRDAAREVALRLPELVDEPFADSSVIPTILLSRLTRQSVTVALSGDGGDELFGGYPQHRKLARLERAFALPLALRRAIARLAPLAPVASVGNGLRHLGSDDLLGAAASLVNHVDPAALRSALGEEAAAVPERFREAFLGAPTDDPVRRSMFADAATYLPDDILTKVDRASMSVALEARVPLIDHRVVRFAAGLPRAVLWHEGRTKAPLRAIVEKRVPRSLLERPKRGFAIPIESLLAAELSEWSERYLAPERLREEGVFDPAGIVPLVERVRAVRGRNELLWFLICFERWFAHVHRGEAIAC